MADTQILPDIEIELTGEELVGHIVCFICYPVDIPFETFGLCGALLAGIEITFDLMNCETCKGIVRCPKCGSL